MILKCRFRSIRRALLLSFLTAPLYLGTCADMAIRISIDSAFDAADPYVVEFAAEAGRQAGDEAARLP